MKKNILLFLSIFLILGCKTRSNEKKSGATSSFFSYYNTIFNSKEALNEEKKLRSESHQDNFYAPYISLLTYDDNPLTGTLEDPMFSDDEGFAMPGSANPQQKGASILQISEAKALKAINKYSVLKEGEEKNKKMFDAHLLLAQSRIYQNRPLEALDALNYIFANMKKDKRVDLARVYQGLAYAKIGDYFRANEIFLALKNDGINRDYEKLRSVFHSETLLASGKREEAVEELSNAFSANKNREMRSRIAFLRGQILAKLDRKEEARESFIIAYKYSNDFEFEVKSQVEIAKTFNAKDDDYEGAKQYLESISKKGTYGSRKNEFYYALGLMANEAGKKDEAQEYFRKALDEKVSDGQIRGLTYYEIGKNYFDKNDYIAAGAYYDSALVAMTYEPSKSALLTLSKNIKNVAQNYYLIKKNDSILTLTKMSEPERIAYFGKHIDALKAKEAKEELERRKEERSKGFDTGDYDANSIFANNNRGFQDFTGGGSKNSFYFANQNTISKGQSEFKQIWGNRSLVDNWRFSNRAASIEDVRNEAMGLATVQNPRRYEPDFYTEQIPTDFSEISALKKDRDTASLGLGRMYENYFSNTELATKTLYDLVDNNPEDDVKLQALYQIFAMNYERNPSAAERAKNMILSDFPYTSYAEFVRNPKSATFSSSSTEVENIYKNAFDLYSAEKFEESKSLIASAMEKYPNDALIPKFSLLNAFNAGKTAGKEIMILQLQQIAFNYPKTEEGQRAEQMLIYLKSDLDMEMTDEQGNIIQQQSQQSNVQRTQQRGVQEPVIAVPGSNHDPLEGLSEEDRKMVLEVEKIQKEQAERLRKINEEEKKKRQQKNN